MCRTLSCGRARACGTGSWTHTICLWCSTRMTRTLMQKRTPGKMSKAIQTVLSLPSYENRTVALEQDADVNDDEANRITYY